jgi:hypothetical protein
MTWSAAITLSIAVLGAVLGLLNTWNGINDRRVRLRVVPKWSISPGFNGLAIEVVNLSAFPITVSEIGFTIGRSRGPLPRRAPIPPQKFVDQTRLPVRLERHQSFSGTFHVDGLENLDISKAYALTTSGVIAFGKSPALRQFVGGLVHHS